MGLTLGLGTRIPGDPFAVLPELRRAVDEVTERLMVDATGNLLGELCRARRRARPAPDDGGMRFAGVEGTSAAGRPYPADVLEFVTLVETVIDERSRSARGGDQAFCLEFEVVFFRDPLEPEWTLARPFASHPELLQVWSQVPGVQPYPFWDTADRPADVPAAEWDHRRRAWATAIGPGTYAEAGLSWRAELPSPIVAYCTDRDGFGDAVVDAAVRVDGVRRERMRFTLEAAALDAAFDGTPVPSAAAGRPDGGSMAAAFAALGSPLTTAEAQAMWDRLDTDL